MALMSYKCPNCGGGLVFDPDSQKFQCEYCLSEFTEEEMKRMEEVSASPAEEGEAVLEEERTAPQEGDSSQGPETGEAAVYTCPSCGAQIVTDATTAASFCYYCHNPVTAPQEGDSSQGPETGEAAVYTCPSCGAQIVTDATTAASFCYYCHNPVVFSGRLSGDDMPDFVIPFAIDKKEATSRFLSWIGKKKFVPGDFFSRDQIEKLSGIYYMPDFVIPFAIDKKEATSRFLSWIGKKKFVPGDFFSRDQIEKLSGIYFPYLIYSCQVDGQAEAEAEEQRTWVSGRTRYTEHKKYQVERAGTLEVKNLTRNALKKSNKELVEGVLPFDMEKLLPFQMGYLSYQVERAGTLEVKNLTRNALKKSNKELVEGVLPFDMEKLLPFQMGYLSGFQAERRDMDGESFAGEAEQEVKQYTLDRLRSSMDTYSSVRIKDYLSGFQAERRDMDGESFAGEAEQEVKQYTLDRLRSSMDTYSSVRIKDSSMEIRDPRWQYALLPVWVMTYGHRAGGKTYYFAMNGQTGKIVRIKDSSMEIRDPRWQYALLPVWVMTYGHRAGGKTYYFAMNGQTGKIWGRLPVDKRKLAGLFFGVFFPVFAALMIGGWFL